MSQQKKAGIIIAIIAAWLIGSQIKEELFPSKPDRPVLKFLAKVARFGMWFLVLADANKPAPDQQYGAVDADHVDHMRSL